MCLDPILIYDFRATEQTGILERTHGTNRWKNMITNCDPQNAVCTLVLQERDECGNHEVVNTNYNKRLTVTTKAPRRSKAVKRSIGVSYTQLYTTNHYGYLAQHDF